LSAGGNYSAGGKRQSDNHIYFPPLAHSRPPSASRSDLRSVCVCMNRLQRVSQYNDGCETATELKKESDTPSCLPHKHTMITFLKCIQSNNRNVNQLELYERISFIWIRFW